MAEVSSLNIPAPSSGGTKGPPIMLLAIGGVVILALFVVFSKRSSATNSASNTLVPGSNANIAFSSLQNSLLNFQGLFEARNAQLLDTIKQNQVENEGLFGQVFNGINQVFAQGQVSQTQLNSIINGVNTLFGQGQLSQSMANQIIQGLIDIQKRVGNGPPLDIRFDPVLGRWYLFGSNNPPPPPNNTGRCMPWDLGCDAPPGPPLPQAITADTGSQTTSFLGGQVSSYWPMAS